ncbi:hypothetical protein BN8_02956 [Fibrisoma limi BUZ 3]|uniref:Uncharacterized protein n=2 Tax=Fibrisoma limi TaxID=663275 RepID=I2GIV2_9BACT|nr:hypothetical protein BN8_02956 [Fibrisoma limi BUZ 3]
MPTKTGPKANWLSASVTWPGRFGNVRRCEPYWMRLNRKSLEVGYGVENVFNVLRIEALHRLTYRELPGATTFAVKVSAQVGL